MRIPKHRVALAVGALAVGIAAVGASVPASAASGWALQSTPNPAGATQATFNGVSCTSTTTCTAVGFFVDGTGHILALAEAWDGANWTSQPTPNPSGALNIVLNGVSCTSATACTAVGNYSDKSGNTKTLAEAWDGATWVIQKTPNPPATTNAVLSGVSCSSPTACTAVGHYFGSSSIPTLAEAWNGAKWVIQKTPVPAGTSVYEFRGVSCASGTACTAVGFSINGSNQDVMLTEAWKGTKWVIQHNPIPSGATSTVLSGVSCSSPTACTAVGDYLGPSTFDTLAESWNGTKWVVQKTPNPAVTTVGALLTSVSCTASTACTAGGYNNVTPPGSATLAEAWNGAKWVIQTTPNPPGAQQSYVNGVSCNSATACIAVGYANVGPGAQAVAEAHS